LSHSGARANFVFMPQHPTLPVLALSAATLLLPFSRAADDPTPAPATDDGWFDFRPTNDNGPSVIGLEDWLDKPACKHGPVLMRADKLVFADTGRPVKLWGVNLGGKDCVPTKEQADYWAERFARYGINAVRLHKPWGDLYTDDDSTALKPEALARLDYFCHALRQRGIYYSWSFFYHRKLGKTDLARLRYADEFVNSPEKKGNQYGATDYIPEMQDILIEATENLLNHVNPHTGLRYADDPALAGVEYQNEAAIMFWSERGLRSMPNTERDVARRFSVWLKTKYGSHEGLVAAWGEKALNHYAAMGEAYADEHLDRENVFVLAKPDDFASENFARLREQGHFHRISDTAEFLHHLQNEFYGRFTERILATGYRGPLIGSCWRGKGDISEYYNLRSDALVGIIDRHNYFGGLSGWKPRAEKFTASAQINKPGGGLLSSSMVQVADRPYSFSEWATVFPNEWVLESPAIIAAYGMGLQGWDASYQFATNTAGRGYSEALHHRNLLWVIERPENIGIYPALSRMILRDDIQEGEVISTRRISLADLQNGKLPWGSESYSGWKDVKTYVGPMPGSALAAGRVVVEFTDRPAASTMPDMTRHERDGVVRSNTGQLAWDVSRPGKGFFTIDAPGTRAIVGFRPDEPILLGDATLSFTDAPFAGVFLSSLNPKETVEQAHHLLLTVVGRARNTGMTFNESRDELLALGDAPVQLEPVTVTVAFEDRDIQAVHVLDHDGRMTEKTVSLAGHRSLTSITINGAKEQALYFVIVTN
jgi:hypothetical protein